MEFLLKMTNRNVYHDYYEVIVNGTLYATCDSSKGVDKCIDITSRMEHRDFTVKSVEQKGLSKLLNNNYKCLIHNPYSMGYIQQLNANGKSIFNKKLYTRMAYGDLFLDMYHAPVPNEDYSILCICRDDNLIGVAYLKDKRDKGCSSYRVICSEVYLKYIVLLLTYYDRYLSMFTSRDIYYGATTVNPVTCTDFMDKVPDQYTINQLLSE